MNYQVFSPPLILQPYVQYIWVLEHTDDSFSTFSPLPDGCPGMMFQQSENGLFLDAQNKEMATFFLYGQATQPAKIHSTGKFRTIGICFYPHALSSLFGLNAHELTDTCVDLCLLQHKKERYLSEKLLNTATLPGQMNILTSGLLPFMEKHGVRKDDTMQYAISRIVQSKGSISVKELLHPLQLSERSLERRFNQSVGISPKLFARICRFQEALKQLRKNRYNKLSDIAYENGYADQSHFIRSFKEFTGVSPFDFRKQVNEVAENFPQLVQ